MGSSADGRALSSWRRWARTTRSPSRPWQAVAQWDLQLADDGSVDALRYGTARDDSEYRQALDGLRTRVATAGATDAFAGERVAGIDGLRAHYENIGAYGVINQRG